MVAKRFRVGQVVGWSRVRVATTVTGTLATAYENGDTVDGVVLATGDLILLKNQTTASENGVYKVAASGAPVRITALDYTSSRGNVSKWATGVDSAGQAVRVTEGTANANKGFLQYSEPGVVGTDNLLFISHPLNGKKG
jgi:hypothetical protein